MKYNIKANSYTKNLKDNLEEINFQFREKTFNIVFFSKRFFYGNTIDQFIIIGTPPPKLLGPEKILLSKEIVLEKYKTIRENKEKLINKEDDINYLIEKFEDKIENIENDGISDENSLVEKENLKQIKDKKPLIFLSNIYLKKEDNFYIVEKMYKKFFVMWHLKESIVNRQSGQFFFINTSTIDINLKLDENNKICVDGTYYNLKYFSPLETNQEMNRFKIV